MSWIFWICFIVSLLVSYWDQRKTLRLKDWALIIGAFLLCEFYVNFFGLLIPVGFIIGLIVMKKEAVSFFKSTYFWVD